MTELSSNALQVAESRYFQEGETWETATRRVADAVAINEPEHKDEFHEAIFEMDFLPAGRILRNAGRHGGSVLNCYDVPIGDSIEEIGQCVKDCLTLWSDGGGTGTNFSFVRPNGTSIKGKGGEASGVVSWMRVLNAAAEEIKSGGGRRAAALALLSVSHPEINKFIDAKMVDGELKNFNISVGVVDSFLEAVIDNKKWDFLFSQRSYGTIQARDLWDKILTNMIDYAEPGLINWNNLIKNNSYYFAPIDCTNPCGEAPLDRDGACDLASIVLPHMNAGQYTNWKKFEKTIRIAVRFLDNVLDINNYSIEKVKQSAFNARRIGIGVMGLAEYLMNKNIKYGSPKSIVEIERLMKFIRDIAYEESVKLSIEKGAFPGFISSPYCKASFIRKLPAKLRMDIREKGIRNVTLMALAPTGTISLLPEVTGGIEPLFAKAYRRSDRVSERVYIHPLYKEIMQAGEVPEWFVDAYDLLPEDHFEVQAACQKYVDGAVSKTINLPKDFTKDQLDKLLLEYIFDLKGVTVYRDGTRKDQILNRMEEDEVKEYLDKETESTLTLEDVDCSSGTCEI